MNKIVIESAFDSMYVPLFLLVVVYSLVLSLPCDPDMFSVVCLQLNGIGVVAECCSVNNVYVLMSQCVCCRLV